MKIKEPKIIEAIDNKLIENMFLACAYDDEIDTFYRLMRVPTRGHGLATSYASRRVTKKFIHFMHSETGLDYSSLLNG